MKNHLIEKKDIYNIVSYSQQEINVEKLFDQLYGMITYMLISPCMKLAFYCTLSYVQSNFRQTVYLPNACISL